MARKGHYSPLRAGASILAAPIRRAGYAHRGLQPPNTRSLDRRLGRVHPTNIIPQPDDVSVYEHAGRPRLASLRADALARPHGLRLPCTWGSLPSDNVSINTGTMTMPTSARMGASGNLGFVGIGMTMGIFTDPLARSYIEKSDVVLAGMSDRHSASLWLAKMHPGRGARFNRWIRKAKVEHGTPTGRWSIACFTRSAPVNRSRPEPSNGQAGVSRGPPPSNRDRKGRSGTVPMEPGGFRGRLSVRRLRHRSGQRRMSATTRPASSCYRRTDRYVAATWCCGRSGGRR